MLRVAVSLVFLTACCVTTVPAQNAPPPKRIVKSGGSSDTQISKRKENEQQSNENTAIQKLVEEVVRIRQMSENDGRDKNNREQENIEIQWKLIKYTGWLVAVGFLQDVALVITLFLI
jgi:hypothetical protein